MSGADRKLRDLRTQACAQAPLDDVTEDLGGVGEQHTDHWLRPPAAWEQAQEAKPTQTTNGDCHDPSWVTVPANQVNGPARTPMEMPRAVSRSTSRPWRTPEGAAAVAAGSM